MKEDSKPERQLYAVIRDTKEGTMKEDSKAGGELQISSPEFLALLRDYAMARDANAARERPPANMTKLERQLAMSLFRLGFDAGVTLEGASVDEAKMPRDEHWRSGWRSGQQCIRQAMEMYRALLEGAAPKGDGI